MVLGPKIRVPWEHPRAPAEHDENWRWLTRLFDQDSGGTRWGTIVVAAADSSTASKDNADFVCDGTGDNITVRAAITAMFQASARGGRLVLLEGTYTFGAGISYTLTAGQELVIEGLSTGGNKQASQWGTTYIKATSVGTDHVFTIVGGQVTFKNLNIAASGSAVSVPIWSDNSMMTVTDCYLSGYGGVVMRITAGGFTNGLHVENCVINASGGNAITSFASDNAVIAFNTIVSTAASTTAVVINGSLGVSCQTTVVGNVVSVAATSTGIGMGNGSTLLGMCIGNTVTSGAIGILAPGSGVHVAANTVNQCARGIVSTGVGNVVVGNNILHNGTPTSAIEVSGQNTFIATNKCNTTCTGSSILSSGTNNSIVFNEGPTGGPASVTDTGTGTKRESDWLLAGQTANINARVGVRLNSTGVTDLRRRINLIEGSGITITIADDAVDEEVDVTFTSTIAAAVAAKGDILVGIAAGSISPLHVDRDGQILMTDSTQTTGVKWGPKVTILATAPVNPRPGDIWIDVS